MKKQKKDKRPNRSYSPDNTVVDFMTDALQLGKEIEEFGMKITAAGGMQEASEADIKRHSELLTKRRNLDRRKVYLLNNQIFPSMANLTVFLEYMAASYGKGGGGYVNKMFEEDLEALFFAKSIVNKNMKNANVFWRFINAICAFDINRLHRETRDTKERPISGFRLILYDIMQESINESIFRIGPFVFNDVLYRKTLGPDMERARAWTSTLAREAYDDLKFDKDRRPALF